MYKNIYIKREKDLDLVHLWDDKKGYQVFPYNKYAFRLKKGGTYKSIYGHELTKVTSWSEDDKNIFEGDVNKETRTLIDLYGNDDSVSKDITVLTFDIEVESDAGFPVASKANNPIISISLHDSKSNNIIAFIIDKENKIQNIARDGEIVLTFPTEIELLQSFVSKWEEIQPDVLTGWNIEFFDIPYIINRLKKLFTNDEPLRLSPIKHIRYNERKEKYVIAGISCLDYLELYKKFSGKTQPNYRLDTIAKAELGAGKIPFTGSLTDLYRTDIQKFIEYNIEDTKLIVRLENKIKLIELVRSICHTCHVPYEDFYSSSRFLEGAILTDLRKKRMVAPNRPDREESETGGGEPDEVAFEGAYVKDPVPGKYSWIYDLDLQSLYPSIMMTLNISPETKVDRILDWDLNSYINNEVHTIVLRDSKKKIPIADFKRIISEKKLSVAASGAVYKNSSMGIIPDILDRWFKTRVEFRKKEKEYAVAGNTELYTFYNNRQITQKILLNSLYGVLGLKSFRFYDVDNAESVTMTGQTVIKTTEKIVNQYYNSRLQTKNVDYTLYIDTDSVFVSSEPLLRCHGADFTDEENIVKATLAIATDVQTTINESYNAMSLEMFNCAQHRFFIKQEVIAKSGLWLAKKKYAQWVINKATVPCDELEVKGIDVVRTSFPIAFRKYLKQLLIDVLHHRNKADIDKDLLSFQNNLGGVSMLDIAKNTSVHFKSKKGDLTYDSPERIPFTYFKKTPAQAKAVLFYNDFLKHNKLDKMFEPIHDGDKIKWVYVTPNPYGAETIAIKGDKDPPEILQFIETYIDRHGMYESELLSKIVDVYTALRWSLPSNTEDKVNAMFDF